MFTSFALIVLGDFYWKEFGRAIFPLSQHSCIFGSKGASKTAPLNFFNECTSIALKKLRIYALYVELITKEDLQKTEEAYIKELHRRNPDNQQRQNQLRKMDETDIESIVEAELELLDQTLSPQPHFDKNKAKFVKYQMCL